MSGEDFLDRRLISVCYLISESNTMILKIIYIVSSQGVWYLIIYRYSVTLFALIRYLLSLYYNYYYYHSLFIIIVVADIIYNIYIVCITYAYVRAHAYILYVQYIQQRVALFHFDSSPVHQLHVIICISNIYFV